MVQTQTLVFTAEMIRLIAEIDEFKGAWRALGNLAPDKLLQLRKVKVLGTHCFESNFHEAVFALNSN